jgi:hypothetical protein
LGDTTSLVPGFPIRKSSDPRSVDSSPRHIAASHVLHRLPVPRHPPCALKHLHTNTKIRRNCIRTPKNPQKRSPQVSDARNHYPRIKHHTPPPKQGNNTPAPRNRDTTPTPGGQTGLLSQSPIVCLAVLDTVFPPPHHTFVVHPPDNPLQAPATLPTAMNPHIWRGTGEHVEGAP